MCRCSIWGDGTRDECGGERDCSGHGGKTWSVPYYSHNHFHIDLRRPDRVGITQNLLADSAVLEQTQAPVANEALIANAQALLNQYKTDLNFTQGEVTMLISDMPNIPPQYAPVMMVQAAPAQTNTQIDQVSADRTIGVCKLVENPIRMDGDSYSAINGVAPIGAARNYFRIVEHRKIPGSAVVTVLRNPEHGTLEPLTGGAGALGGYWYVPKTDYFGQDHATFQVEIDGKKIKMEYFFNVLQGVADDYTEEQYKNLCPNGNFWKISSTLDANGNSTVTSVEYQSPTIAASAANADINTLASTLGSIILSTLSVDPSSVTFNLTDLPSGAVGQATGNTITLDTNAANYNWFIDTTPADNSEYLPTSNPNEWVAKEGTAAYGKMDMLSVLLHEYGHALGIEHSADNHDYMATTLTPGVRRMPSADELALMQQLVAQAKGDTPSLTLPQGERGPDNAPIPLPIPLGAGFGIAFLGRLRGSRYGDLSIAPDYATLTTKYAVAANATFANLNTPAGWNTQGSVDIASGTGSATLNEISTSQTRLSQVFMLNDKDRYLSFTLAGIPLPNPLPQAGEGANGAAPVNGDGGQRLVTF